MYWIAQIKKHGREPSLGLTQFLDPGSFMLLLSNQDYRLTLLSLSWRLKDQWWYPPLRTYQLINWAQWQANCRRVGSHSRPFRQWFTYENASGKEAIIGSIASSLNPWTQGQGSSQPPSSLGEVMGNSNYCWMEVSCGWVVPNLPPK
jgi:hypothetical protein